MRRRNVSLKAGQAAAEQLASALLGYSVRKAIDPLTPGGFLLICEAVTEKLMRSVQGTELEALTDIIDELDVDWAKLSPSATATALAAITKAITDTYAARVLPKISEVMIIEGPTAMAATRLAVIASQKLDISASLAERDLAAETFIRESHLNYIRDSSGRRIEALSERARQVVARGAAQGIGSDTIAADLAAAFEEDVPRPDSYWRVVADAFVGRARAWSTVGALEDAEIQTFELVAVLDEVTTDICRYMDGKIFQVSAARGLLDTLSNLPDPAAVKFANPWMRVGRDEDGNKRIYVPNEDGSTTTVASVERSGIGTRDDRGEYSGGMTEAQLAALGVPIPPFHGRCRTLIVAGPDE